LEGEDQYIYERWAEEEWKAQYTFSEKPFPLDAFTGTCRHHQTSPESPFTRNWAASLATEKGRMTLVEKASDGRLIITEDGVKKETIIMGLDNNLLLLEELFNLKGFRLDRR
jgi:N-hydroxyarylamine O-acetyltransferase